MGALSATLKDAMTDIYNFIVQNGKLSNKHSDELKKKRGFNEKTITDNKFFSGGKYLLDIEAQLTERFETEKLIDAGVCIRNEKHLQLAPILQEDRIIIPYLDKKDNAYLLRPHKLGLKGVPIQIYQSKNVTDRHIILTEGEFKAAASVQLGLPAVAIPGIASFSEQHFERLTKFLGENRVKKVTIIFDHEVKDNPKFKNYKQDPFKRYDTEFYAQYMCRLLEKEGFESNIGTLPKTWMIQGKIDIDGALAKKKTREDFDKIMNNAKGFRQFIKDLDKDVQHIILKKNARKYQKKQIRVEFGRYVVTRGHGKNEYDEIISNFTLRIIATHETAEGIVREVVMTNEFGQTSNSFSLSPESMTGPDSFSTFCYSKGNYIWRGKREDLFNIWESEFLMDDGRLIIEPDHIGWVPSEGMFLFGNVAINADGDELRPDNNHIYWTEKKGIKPVPLSVTSGRTQISEGIPYLSFIESPLEEIKQKLSDTIGDNETALCLGWITAVPFLEEVFNNYGCFPFLFVTGRRGSGKSTIAEWLMNFFGLENCGKMASDTTAVSINRYLAYYSSLPLFLDEYRNTKPVVIKNGLLRNAYNRQSAGKGMRSEFGVREAKIRGTLLISGEETPEDNALLTRCIVVYVSEKNRKENHFNWFMSNRTKFSSHILKVLKNKKKLLPRFMEALNEGKQYFVNQGTDERTAVNYAIVAAGYAAAFGDGDVDFAKWITLEAQRVKDQHQEEQAVSVFLEDLIALKTRGVIDSGYWAKKDGKYFLYFHGLYNVWAGEYRKSRGIEPFKAASIRSYLTEEPGFLDINEPVRIKGTLKKCAVFDEGQASEFIQALCDDPMIGDLEK